MEIRNKFNVNRIEKFLQKTPSLFRNRIGIEYIYLSENCAFVSKHSFCFKLHFHVASVSKKDINALKYKRETLTTLILLQTAVLTTCFFGCVRRS